MTPSPDPMTTPGERMSGGGKHRLVVRAALVAAGAALLTLTGCAAWRIGQSAELVRRSEPFQRARDGAKFADLPDQLRGDAPVDIVLIQAGGNDVIRMADLDALQSMIDTVAAAARARAPQVVLMPVGNVGNAPFFFAPLSWWMTQRSRQMHRFVRDAAQRHGAHYVNLFHERDDDPFVQMPELNARDGLHPSDSGYRVWFDELSKQTTLF